jgi:hypothetical protein
MSCRGECWENGAPRCVDCDPPRTVTVRVAITDAMAVGETLRALAQHPDAPPLPKEMGEALMSVGTLLVDAARQALGMPSRPARPSEVLS